VRPVNLIPVEDRRGRQAPARSGRLTPYMVLGSLLLVLGGVSALVLTGNQISEREAELAELKQEEAQLAVRAQALSGYTAFGSVRDQRTTTVASLADSRFDWERVMREFSLVLPGDVWLMNVTGTVNPTVTVNESPGITTRASVPGPALELVGCALSQDAVAGFVSALHDVDGVTRVGVATSELPDLGTGGNAAGASGGDDCRTRDFIARFEIVVAFDAAPVGGTAGTVPPVSSGSGSVPTSTDSSGAAEAAAEQNVTRNSIETQSDRARRAISYIPGG
jgi:Tfp pilus assembly protein PilN